MASSLINVTLPANETFEAAPVGPGGLSFSEFKFMFRCMFYLVTPNETTYARYEEAPNYFIKGLPYAPIVYLMEMGVALYQNKKLPRFGDSLCSFCCFLLIFLPVAVLGQIEMNLYVWVYEQYRLIDLPYTSVPTWFMCILLTDLSIYWWHRCAHEINFIWAFHQVHHTSQDFNLSIGMRLPTFNRYVAIIFSLPLALIFPPSVFYVHYQLNYIFQLWIHSSTVPSLGFLDYIINTPSLHRVHHGRNRYCIDKNYAAVFSFWDILFGTFELERKDEEIYYGLVHSINSFDPLYIQIHHFKNIIQQFFQHQTIGNKISTFIKGPGWQPGKPRLGELNDIEVIPADKELYDRKYSLGLKVYLYVHFAITFVIMNKIKITKLFLPSTMVWLQALYVVWSIMNIGSFLEHRRIAPILEGTRCAFYMVLEILLKDILTTNVYMTYFLRFTFAVSCLYWAAHINQFTEKQQKKID